MLSGVDHVAIVVRDTEEALRFWRDTLGLEVLFTTSGQGGTVALTNLALGNSHLQLVEPLAEDHPLLAWLGERESALHHLGIAVGDVSAYRARAVAEGLVDAETPLIAATLGRRAIFLDPTRTGEVVIEIIDRMGERGRTG